MMRESMRNAQSPHIGVCAVAHTKNSEKQPKNSPKRDYPKNSAKQPKTEPKTLRKCANPYMQPLRIAHTLANQAA
jgi:hypothetical protein